MQKKVLFRQGKLLYWICYHLKFLRNYILMRQFILTLLIFNWTTSYWLRNLNLNSVFKYFKWHAYSSQKSGHKMKTKSVSAKRAKKNIGKEQKIETLLLLKASHNWNSNPLFFVLNGFGSSLWQLYLQKKKLAMREIKQKTEREKKFEQFKIKWWHWSVKAICV